jgi:hypothetical protein
VRRRNRDTTLALFRGVVDRCVILDFTTTVTLRHDLRQGRRQRRLTMVNVTNRANVDVGFCSLKFFFSHFPDLWVKGLRSIPAFL